MWRNFLQRLQNSDSPIKEIEKEIETYAGDIGYFARFFRSLEQLCFHMMICFYLTLIFYASINQLTLEEGATLIHFVIWWHLAAILLLFIKPIFQNFTKSPLGILLSLAIIVSLVVAFLSTIRVAVNQLVGWFNEALHYFEMLV